MSVSATPIAVADGIPASAEPATASVSSARAIRPTVSHRHTWLGQIIGGWPSPDPLVRLRQRSVSYYLRRAAAHPRRNAKYNLPPRPDSVKDLRRCRRNTVLSLTLLALSVAFIVCYCLMPALRVSLGSYEGFACSTAVVALLFSALAFAYSMVEIWRIHRDARRYASFVLALVDEKGHFNVKADDNTDYAAYLKALNLDVLVILQHEYYEWFTNGNPPVRQVPADYVPATFDAE